MEIHLPKLAANAIKEFVAQPYIHEDLPAAEADLDTETLHQLHLKVQGALRPLEDFKTNLDTRIEGVRSIVKGAEEIHKAQDYHKRDKVSGIDHFLTLYGLMTTYIEEAARQANIPNQRGELSLHSYLKAALVARTLNWLRTHHRNGLRDFLKYEERELCLIGWGMTASFTSNQMTTVSSKIYDYAGLRKGHK